MSVVGVGTDIVEVGRIASMAEAAKQRLAKRVLTPEELAVFAEHPQADSYLAKRWAAKEAASKALGTGIADSVSFQHFHITNTDMGAPIIDLSDRALELAHRLGANSWHISISDEKHYALAFVVLSK
ncbi:holo-ACP synthase [Thalassotalea euphylliae]|uniref:holo-ACP synthase n=1 Tax=Thalassotalea euphylliae TaxID=1655234 RepID=UPI0036453156